MEGSLLHKPRKKPQWDPPTLQDITDEDIEQLYFTKPSPNSLVLPSDLDLHTYPYSRFSLPTERDVYLALQDGQMETPHDVIQWFEKGHKYKAGVKEKVIDILERKSTLVADNGKQVLQWNKTTGG